ncbi:SNARE protein, putative [Hepatocystis sp. ex Piliocolobus tephrosceles]|nr:SNARE protein, putative [Hepatocystis sp. ex Piliocolobus tephrosceles]
MNVEKEDPFYEAKREVSISLNKLQGLYNNWISISDKHSILAKEKCFLIKEEIKYLNKDLNDLENSVNVVKNNKSKFNISSEEIENRTNDLKNIRNTLNNIDRNLKRNTTTVLNCDTSTISSYGKVTLKEQDNDLEELAESAERLHNAAITINAELKDQQRLLEELETEMDYSNEKMNFVTERISDFLKTKNSKVLSLILYLSAISFFLVFVLIVS